MTSCSSIFFSLILVFFNTFVTMTFNTRANPFISDKGYCASGFYYLIIKPHTNVILPRVTVNVQNVHYQANLSISKTLLVSLFICFFFIFKFRPFNKLRFSMLKIVIRQLLIPILLITYGTTFHSLLTILNKCTTQSNSDATQ